MTEHIALDEVGRVTDDELMVRVRNLVRADQRLDARLVLHLGEVDARGLYRELAHGSMFTYCVDELGMSEHQAYLRIQAARLSRQFPRVLQLLGQGALNLTAIKLLAPHLTEDNHANLLEQAQGKRRNAYNELVPRRVPHLIRAPHQEDDSELHWGYRCRSPSDRRPLRAEASGRTKRVRAPCVHAAAEARRDRLPVSRPHHQAPPMPPRARRGA